MKATFGNDMIRLKESKSEALFTFEPDFCAHRILVCVCLGTPRVGIEDCMMGKI